MAVRGVPGTFTLTPRVLNVEYIYCFKEDWDYPTLVAAGPDGLATFTFTPAAPGIYPMQVFARSADGAFSANYREYYFMVNSAP